MIAAFLWCIAVPIALLLEARLSRRESLADASAVQFTATRAACGSALEKMASTATPPAAVNPANAAPVVRHAAAASASLVEPLARHAPPIERRIAWLKALEGTP